MTAPAQDLNSLFAGLTIEPTDEALPEPRRGGAVSGPNPFSDPLQASIEHSKPYTVYLPKEAINRATFLINSAARKASVGVRIVVDVQRDKDGKVVPGKDGKAQYVTQTQGENKGKVRVRFQGTKERKAQKAPRPFSIVKDKNDANLFHVRRRSDKAVVFSGTQEQAQARYAELKQQAINAAAIAELQAQAPAQTPAPTGATQPTPESTVETDQGATPSDVEPKQEAAAATA